MDHQWIRQTIQLALENVRSGGGPFAALIVKDGVVVARGTNSVARTNDPTAHAEIVAIREACRILGAFQLTGCEMYSSCEPCPMCLGALFWARPDRVFFAATKEDASAAGFDDSLIYAQVALPPSERLIPMVRLIDPQSAQPFQEWVNRTDKTAY